jgi:hypothetical protein
MTDTRAYQQGAEAIRKDTPETQSKQAGAEVVEQAAQLEMQAKQAGVEPIYQAAILETRGFQFGVEVIGIWEDDNFINFFVAGF